MGPIPDWLDQKLWAWGLGQPGLTNISVTLMVWKEESIIQTCTNGVGF